MGVRIDDLAADLLELVSQESRLDLDQDKQRFAIVFKGIKREVGYCALLLIVSR